jgi:hypothetical protein
VEVPLYIEAAMGVVVSHGSLPGAEAIVIHVVVAEALAGEGFLLLTAALLGLRFLVQSDAA